ncbi:hypothetical protein JCM3774_002841 [Rhodotorula dairenensis]
MATPATTPLEAVSIVWHCYDADERLEEALTTFGKSRAALARDSPLNPKTFRKTHGSSIASLYAVSSKWRNLCKPYRFKVLIATRTSEPIFGVWIAPQYGRYYTRIDLRDVKQLHVVEVVKALPWLSSLIAFDLRGAPMSIFSQKANDVVNASLKARVIASLKRAQALVIGKYRVDDIRDMTFAAGATLTLEIAESGFDHSIFDATDDESEAGDESSTPSLPETTLLELVKLELRGEPWVLANILRTAPLEALPKLQSLTVLPAGCNSFPSRLLSSLARYTEQHAHVRKVTAHVIEAPAPLGHPDPHRLSQHGARVTTLPLVQPTVAMTEPETVCDRLEDAASPAERQDVLAPLDSVIAFAAEWRDRAVNAQDWADVARLAKVLQPMDVERMFHRA